MKIHIAYRFKSGPWGGGNQFLKALKGQCLERGVYTEEIAQADIVLFDSYQNLKGLFLCWLLYPKKTRVHRLGPVFHLHRKGLKWKVLDRGVIVFANLFADKVIFQSEWSYRQAVNLGFKKNKKYSVIVNAVDTSVFSKKKEEDKKDGPLQLIYTSWSSNLNKGFHYLQFLDTHLDFHKYQMAFVGNTPVTFRNIKTLPPMSSTMLSEALRRSDIYISPVKDDACSNAILEALASGLPVIALDSGGNGELVKEGGLLFTSEEGLLDSIEKVGSNLALYSQKIIIKSMRDICNDYVDFMCASIK